MKYNNERKGEKQFCSQNLQLLGVLAVEILHSVRTTSHCDHHRDRDHDHDAHQMQNEQEMMKL